MQAEASPVKNIVTTLETGFSLALAVQGASGQTLAQIACELGCQREELSALLNARPSRTSPELRAKLVAHLGMDATVVDGWIERERQRRQEPM